MALGRLAQEDPSFRVKTDEESGQTIISGMGELHLDIIVDRMRREFNVEANVGKPQVAYRETIRKSDVKSDYKHVKQSGGKGQYGHVVIEISPMNDVDKQHSDVKDDFCSSTKSLVALSLKNLSHRLRRGCAKRLPVVR